MSTNTPESSPAAARLGGLDGLRAIAVTLVVVYHFWPTALPGGFLGVDVFFVISGFLITSLLLDEHHLTGRISLVGFWRRRARRLLPALALVLLVSTAAALIVGGDLLVNIGAQIAGAAFFVANWVYIVLGADYFAHDNPELFRNTWSLAIEEQFYLLLPLVLLLLAFRMRSRASRTLLFGALATVSACWMAELHALGGEATRIYFGTDTHAFGLLLGVALACAVPRRSPGASPSPRLRFWQQCALLLAGALGLGALLWLALTLREGSPESFLGGFQLASLAVLLTAWSASRAGSWLGSALDARPLRWVGERSYGIYLWHWPVLLIVTAAMTSNGPTLRAAPIVALALTLGLAILSYRYLEQPVRRLGLRRSISLLCRPARLRGRRLGVAIAVYALLVATVPAAAYAISTAPAQSSSAEAIARGQAALEAQNPSQTPRKPEARAGAREAHEAAQGRGRTAEPNEQGAGADQPGSDPAQNPNRTPTAVAEPPPPIESWDIFAVGDSVMLASFPELLEVFPDIWVDADVSRGLAVGVGIVANLEAEGALRPVIVVGLGTNGPIQDSDLELLLQIAGDRRIVLVNAFGDRWWIPEVNAQLRAFADAHRGVVLADWESTIPEVEGGLADDWIHPNPIGAEAYAQVVQAALEALRQPDELPPKEPSRR